jgi:hypothetical protein
VNSIDPRTLAAIDQHQAALAVRVTAVLTHREHCVLKEVCPGEHVMTNIRAMHREQLDALFALALCQLASHRQNEREK